MTLLPLVILSALASPLDDYAGQKHTERDRVTADTCEEKYIQRCQAACEEGDGRCEALCETEAPEFCEDRRRRQRRKTAEVVAKGASVGAGAAAVVAQNAIVWRRHNRALEEGAELVEVPTDAYTIDWFRTTALGELGGGVFAGPVGVGTAHAQVRWAWFGAGLQSTFMHDGTSALSETDVGPTLSIASRNIVFSLQPSLLVSVYKPGEEPDDPTFDPTELGFGVRSYTTVHLHRAMLHFDPMLGVINGQWSYHLRVGLGYRITPAVYARLSYDYRDIVDLTDLDISSASLQGAVLSVGVRFN